MVSIPNGLCDTQCDVCLYIDIMYINGMPFLTTISKNIKYCTDMWVADGTASTIVSLVESILKLYQQAGFQVVEVCTNHQFKPVLQVLQDGGWSFMTNLANTQEHVPEAEHTHPQGAHLCHLSWDSLQDAPTNCYLLHGDGNHGKVKLLSCQRWMLKLLQPKGNPPPCQA